jgi:pimeloyl-ACP methyl ester carboxylesterase
VIQGGSWRALYPFTPKRQETPSGHDLSYLDEGPRSAPPVLLLHGNPTWSFMWRDIVLGLRDGHRVVAPDHLGCGLSDKPQDWSYRLADHVANVECLVVELDLRDITLGVHDWGGAIGMGLARRHPDRISRLIVLNTAAFPSKAMPWRIAVCRPRLLGPLLVRGANGFARAATLMATAKGLSAEVKAGYLAPYGCYADRIAILRFVQDIPMGPGHPSWTELIEIEQSLERLRDRPMLLLWGDRDWCFTTAFRDEWQRRFPDAEVHAFGDAGHYVVEDAADGVLSRVREFLSRRA